MFRESQCNFCQPYAWKVGVRVPPSPPSPWKSRPCMYVLCACGDMQMWLSKNYGFDLADPLLHCTPSSSGYSSLNDRSLRGYMAQPVMRRRLNRHGLLTRDGHVRCSLRELNHYRSYLHRCYQQKMYLIKVTANDDWLSSIVVIIITTTHHHHRHWTVSPIDLTGRRPLRSAGTNHLAVPPQSSWQPSPTGLSWTSGTDLERPARRPDISKIMKQTVSTVCDSVIKVIYNIWDVGLRLGMWLGLAVVGLSYSEPSQMLDSGKSIDRPKIDKFVRMVHSYNYDENDYRCDTSVFN